MRNLYTVILLLLNCLHFRAGQAQSVVHGVVLDKAGKQGIPGASVIVRGADNGSSTDMQGHFQLMIPADTATLWISAVGWATQQQRVRAGDSLVLRLREQCIVDFFYRRSIGLSYYGGVTHTPVGGALELFYPFLLEYGKLRPAFRLTAGYQTNLQGNQQRLLRFDVDELLADCRYNVDVSFVYNAIGLPGRGNWNFSSRVATVRLEELPLRGFSVLAGGGYAERKREGRSRNGYGLQLGAGGHVSWAHTYLFSPEVRVTRWPAYWQLQGGIRRAFRRWQLGLEYNRIADYHELNVKTGFELPY